MHELIQDILDALRRYGTLTSHQLDRIIQMHNRAVRMPTKHFAKKNIWPAYMRIKTEQPDVWGSWQVDNQLEDALRQTVRMKPRRTASGVATITVITRPFTCSSNCVFCPSDVRMPKSYVHDEPACQRAERNYFDPYLQVSSRLCALEEMGHPTDKVELIVLGGTFTDYPACYQTWFIHELFRALNEWTLNTATSNGGTLSDGELVDGTWTTDTVEQRYTRYIEAGIENDPAALEAQVRTTQQDVANNQITFNQAIEQLYGKSTPWHALAETQTATIDQLIIQHVRNEQALHRCVGLVIETRPDALCEQSLLALRELGCTKIQMGVQSLDENALAACGRIVEPGAVEQAFELLRAFGFKSHAHFMANLPGSTPETDKQAWSCFMHDVLYQPDEVKLYPCALIAGSRLEQEYKQGTWVPYSEEDLIDVLASDVLTTPRHTRISRMIRDFSAESIAAGNKKANLRQLVETEVERRVTAGEDPACEMRMREIATDDVRVQDLSLHTHHYTTSNTEEYFLEWIDENDTLAAFLRLSLPHKDYLANHKNLPISTHEAMIREVHVYGTAARIAQQDGSAQHAGLGRTLIDKACAIAKEQNFTHINVISAIGTRNYYRNLGFEDAGLYQRKVL